MDSPAETVLAVDVGGTTIKGALVDPAGRFLREDRRPTPASEGGEAVVGAIASLVGDLAATAPDPGAVRGVGLVAPGVVDGVVVFSGNLGLRGLPLGERIAAATGLAVIVEHDARAAGLAESTLGAARDVADHLVVGIGTGISAAVHSDRRSLRGAVGLAGEIGHVPVHPGGERCPCGQRGCLERYASAAAIARRYAELGGPRDACAREVAARRTTDAAAARAWSEAIDALAIGLVACTMVADPELIVLAGGLSEAGEELRAPLAEELAARLTWRPPPAVVTSVLGHRATLVGAAVLGWTELPGSRVDPADWYSPICT